MLSHHSQLQSVAAAALLLLTAGGTQASINKFDNEAAFLHGTIAIGVDRFDDLSQAGTLPAPLTRSAGSHAYTISTSGLQLFAASPEWDPALSTNLATDSITLGGFSQDVFAVGGVFFGTDQQGAWSPGELTLTVTDSAGSMSTVSLNDTAAPSFIGFVSTDRITSLTFSAAQPTDGFLWPTLDNLTLAAAVPEPETSALMTLGAVLLGLVGRRKHRASGY